MVTTYADIRPYTLDAHYHAPHADGSTVRACADAAIARPLDTSALLILADAADDYAPAGVADPRPEWLRIWARAEPGPQRGDAPEFPDGWRDPLTDGVAASLPADAPTPEYATTWHDYSRDYADVIRPAAEPQPWRAYSHSRIPRLIAATAALWRFRKFIRGGRPAPYSYPVAAAAMRGALYALGIVPAPVADDVPAELRNLGRAPWEYRAAEDALFAAAPRPVHPLRPAADQAEEFSRDAYSRGHYATLLTVRRALASLAPLFGALPRAFTARRAYDDVRATQSMARSHTGEWSAIATTY